MSDIKLIKEDVVISAMDDTECESCGRTATHNVLLDLRGNGGGVNVGYFCETCATETRERIQATLPSEAETDELDRLRAENAGLREALGLAANHITKACAQIVNHHSVSVSRIGPGQPCPICDGNLAWLYDAEAAAQRALQGEKKLEEGGSDVTK